MSASADQLLILMAKMQATDLVVALNVPPMLKIDDRWRALDLPRTDGATVQQWAEELREQAAGTDSWRLPTELEFVHKRLGQVHLWTYGYPKTQAILLFRAEPS